MAITKIRFRRGNGLNQYSTTNLGGITPIYFQYYSPTASDFGNPAYISEVAPWFNLASKQFWIDGLCVNPTLVAESPGDDSEGNAIPSILNIGKPRFSSTSSTEIEIPLTLNLKSGDTGNSLSYGSDGGLFLSAAQTGATLIERFNSLVTINDPNNNNAVQTTNSNYAPNLASNWNREYWQHFITQGGTQEIEEGTDSQGQPTTTVVNNWDNLPTSINPSTGQNSLNTPILSIYTKGNGITGAQMMTQTSTYPGLREYYGLNEDSPQNVYSNYNHHAMTTLQFWNKTFKDDGTIIQGMSQNLMFPKYALTQKDNTFYFYEGFQVKQSFTIPSDAERFAKSMKIVNITRTGTENNYTYTDPSTESGTQGQDGYTPPTTLTSDNSSGIIGVIEDGRGVIRLEVADSSGENPQYLYLGIDPLISYKTLSATDHASNTSYVIKGSGYTTTNGYIPEKLLREDGSWITLSPFTAATNSTSTGGGTEGLVPAPSNNTYNKPMWLNSNGEWAQRVVEIRDANTGTTSFSTLGAVTNYSTIGVWSKILEDGSSDTIYDDVYLFRGSTANNETNIDFTRYTTDVSISGSTKTAQGIEITIPVIDGGTF